MASNYPPGFNGGIDSTDSNVPQTCKNGHVWTTPMYSELGGWFYVDEMNGPVCPVCKEEALDDQTAAENALCAARNAGNDIPHVG